MEAVYPDLPGVSGALLIGWRRRPGSPVAGDNNQQMFAVVVKRAYTVAPSHDAVMVTGMLMPDAAGPAILAADAPGPPAYESDLAIFKPEADLIVLPMVAPVPLSIAYSGTVRMAQPAVPPPLLGGLGWEPKVDSPRTAEAGDVKNITQQLPDDFSNRFFNGYRRLAVQGGAVAYPPPGAPLLLTRAGNAYYGFGLPAAAPALRHHWYTGTGKDDPSLWRTRDVAMNLDTIVIEPDADRAYLVWRAAWPVAFAGPPEAIPNDANRRVVVSIAEA